MDGGVLGKVSANVLQLGCLLVARDGDTATLPRGDALLQGGVVELSAAPQDCFQRSVLGRRGTQLLLVGFANGLLIDR